MKSWAAIIGCVLGLVACTRYIPPHDGDGGRAIDLTLRIDRGVDAADASVVADGASDIAPTDAERPDAVNDTPAPDLQAGVVIPSSFFAEWTTPNTIRWGWEVAGQETDFLNYELVVAESAADALARTGTARVITKREAPELAFFVLPGTSDAVVATTSYQLTPDKEYFAQLVVYDIHGGVAQSAVASGRTLAEPQNELFFFADSVVAGDYTIPDTLVADAVNPYAGTHCLRYDADICFAPGNCFENLRVQGNVRDMSFVDDAIFGRMLAELTISLDKSEPSYWSELRLLVGDKANTSQLYGVSRITIAADAQYHLIQVPLAALHPFSDESKPALSVTTLREGVFELGIGGQWSEGALVRIDQLRLRW